MKKEVFLALGIVILILAGAFAQVIDEGLSNEVSNYVKSFVSKAEYKLNAIAKI